MSFRQEGVFPVTVVDAFLSVPKFPLGKNSNDNQANNRGEAVQVWFDVVLKVESADGQWDYWHGEISNRSGTGNFSDKVRWEMTLSTLAEIGFPLNSIDELMAQVVDEQRANVSTATIPNLYNDPQNPIQASVTVEGAPGRTNPDKKFYNIKYLNSVNGGGGSVKPLSLAAISASFTNGGFTAQEAAAPQPTVNTPAPQAQQAEPAPRTAAPVQQQAAPRPGFPAGNRPAAPGASKPNPYV